MNKKLYVVSSYHYSDNENRNTEFQVADILPIRLQVIEALARTVKSGAYFSDGVAHLEGTIHNVFLSDKISEQWIQEELRELYAQGGISFCMYDKLKTVELFKTLQEENLRFTIKQTERNDFDKIEAMVSLVMKEISTKQLDFTYDELIEYTKTRPREWRDEHIVRNIGRNGRQENILFIGRDHQLKTLPLSDLDWYRLNIDNESDGLYISGIVPQCFQEQLSKIIQYTPSGKPLKQLIEYI